MTCFKKTINLNDFFKIINQSKTTSSKNYRNLIEYLSNPFERLDHKNMCSNKNHV